MRSKIQKVDKLFLASVVSLIIIGFFIFTSASLGLLAKSKGNFGKVLFNQTFFGLFLGTIALVIFSRIHFRVWRKYAFYIFILSIILTALVFIPKFGFAHGGAKRWISLAGLSFQPAEFLKLGFVIYFAAWLSGVKSGIKQIRFGLVPFLVLMLIVTALLLNQPDIGTFVIIFIAGFTMFVIAGAKWRDIVILILIATLGFFFIAQNKPYALERITTFFNPSQDSLGSSYQLQQSLIAIGSGGIFGRGPGQSIQKFGFLPEPIGDSVFAVAGEEFGFVGSSLLVALFIFFAYLGIRIGKRSSDLFGGLLTVGIVILIVFQSFFNMASMLGIVPLSGLPLLFVSHGGTALFFTLASVGIILNVSRHQGKAR